MKSITQSPTEDDFVQNPYPFYDRARALGDVVEWAEYDMPVAFSHQAVTMLLRDKRFGRVRLDQDRPPPPEHLVEFERIEALSLLELEGSDHTRIRRLLTHSFSEKRISDMAPMIGDLTRELISELPDGPFDLIARFAQKLPVLVIANMIGVPETEAPQLLTWSNAMVAMYQARRSREIENAANTAAAEFFTFLRALVEKKRRMPGNDLISLLISAEQDGQKLTEDELIATTVLLLNAGHEATVHTLGNGVFAYLDQSEQFRISSNNAAAFVEEVLRFDPPLHLFTRVAHADVELFGETIKAGQTVGAALAAANRDPGVFADPNTFNSERAQTRHMSLGLGPHFCVGAALARLELQIALPALCSEALSLRLAQTPQYANLFHFHGLKQLIVERSVP